MNFFYLLGQLLPFFYGLKKGAFDNLYEIFIILLSGFYFSYNFFFANYKLVITGTGIRSKSITKMGIVKWEEIQKITWKSGSNFTTYGMYAGSFNVIKFITKKNPLMRSIKYTIWNEEVSRELGDTIGLWKKRI